MEVKILQCVEPITIDGRTNRAPNIQVRKSCTVNLHLNAQKEIAQLTQM